MSLAITLPSSSGLLFLNVEQALVFTGTGHDNAVGISTSQFAADGLPEGMEYTQSRSSATIDTFTVNATTDLITFGSSHGLAVGQRVTFTSTGALPAGLAIDTEYLVSATGFTSTAIKVTPTDSASIVDITDTGTGTHTGSALNPQIDTMVISGTPTVAGIYNVALTFTGLVSSVFETVVEQYLMIVEGDGYLGFYHIDESASPDEVRTAIDLQYNLRTRTFASASFDVAAGLDLYLGETLRLHAIISRNGARTLGDGTPNLPSTAPTPLSLIIRPKGRLDAAPIARFSAPDGEDDLAHDAGSTRPVPYFDVSADSARLRRIFRQLNRAAGADSAADSFACEGQLAFTLDGRAHVTPRFPVIIRQPSNR